jgi:hypothetical protein
MGWGGGLQIKLERMRQEMRVHELAAEEERTQGKLNRSLSSLRLLVDARRAEEQVAPFCLITRSLYGCW